MGVFSEMDMDMRTGQNGSGTLATGEVDLRAKADALDDARQEAEAAAAQAALASLTDEESGDNADEPQEAAHTEEKPTEEKPSDAEIEDQKRREHEASEAKRKADWEAKKRAREEAELFAWENALAMDDDALVAASMKRVGDDAERITRRNMKQCVTEMVQTYCLEDAEFAKQVMHPRKNMINCFRYINRKAKEFILQEMKDNDIKPDREGYGSDVPDDLCYQWAKDYFMDMEAPEDKVEEEEFVPKPYVGKSVPKSTPKKKPEKKKPEPKKEPPKETPAEKTGQLDMFSILTEDSAA